jgi:hypothetical protein
MDYQVEKVLVYTFEAGNQDQAGHLAELTSFGCARTQWSRKIFAWAVQTLPKLLRYSYGRPAQGSVLKTEMDFNVMGVLFCRALYGETETRMTSKIPYRKDEQERRYVVQACQVQYFMTHAAVSHSPGQ